MRRRQRRSHARLAGSRTPLARSSDRMILLWERRKARCSSPMRTRSIAASAAPTLAPIHSRLIKISARPTAVHPPSMPQVPARGRRRCDGDCIAVARDDIPGARDIGTARRRSKSIRCRPSRPTASMQMQSTSTARTVDVDGIAVGVDRAGHRRRPESGRRRYQEYPRVTDIRSTPGRRVIDFGCKPVMLDRHSYRRRPQSVRDRASAPS